MSDSNNSTTPLLRIDLKKIIKARAPLFPSPIIYLLEKIVHQRELNQVLEYAYPREGSPFAAACYQYLDVDIEAVGLDKIPADERFVFASNHPLGGLDGIGIVKLLGEKYGDNGFRLLVNDMLMNIAPLKKLFIPINKYGKQGRERTQAVNDAYHSDMQIMMFPAGLVSRLNNRGEIRDLQWQKSFVAKAIESDRKIIPMKFEGLNRMRFYRIAHWRRKLHIPVNIEQAFLPAELFAARGKKFRVAFGDPIDPTTLRNQGHSTAEIAELVRNSIYEITK